MALGLLDDLVARGRDLVADRTLEHDAFATWHSEVTSILVGAFGDETYHVTSFQAHIRYGGPLVAYAEPREIQAARNRAISNALAAVEGFVRQLRATSNHGTTESMPTIDSSGIFVSHSSKDALIVNEFVKDILELGCGVPYQQIFCISSDGQGIPPGQYFVPFIRERVQRSRILIPWISESFLQSAFCMCELGAAWAMLPGDGLLPVVAGVDLAKLQGILQGMQVLRSSSKRDFNQLRDEVTRMLSLKPRATGHWENLRDSFMSRLP